MIPNSALTSPRTKEYFRDWPEDKGAGKMLSWQREVVCGIWRRSEGDEQQAASPCFSGGSPLRVLRFTDTVTSPVWSDTQSRQKSLGLTEKPFHFHGESAPWTEGQTSLSLDLGYRQCMCAPGGNLLRGKWRSAYLFTMCQEHATYVQGSTCKKEQPSFLGNQNPFLLHFVYPKEVLIPLLGLMEKIAMYPLPPPNAIIWRLKCMQLLGFRKEIFSSRR